MQAFIAQTSPWIAIVGIGESGWNDLSQDAQRQIANADVIFAGSRHHELLRPHYSPTCSEKVWASPIASSIDDMANFRGTRLLVIATGDPMEYGVGNSIAKRWGYDAIAVESAPSTASLVATKMGWADYDLISLLIAPPSVLAGYLKPGAKIIVYIAGADGARRVASYLDDNGHGDASIVALSYVGGDRESIYAARADEWRDRGVPPLTSLAIELPNVQESQAPTLQASTAQAPTLQASTLKIPEPNRSLRSPFVGFRDSDFVHDGQITGRFARLIAISALEPTNGDIFWDIGAGAGSIAIEWCRHAPQSQVFGVEKSLTRYSRARENARRLGVDNYKLSCGTAMEEVPNWPSADAVFIGGGLTRELLDLVVERMQVKARLVVHAVTIESQSLLLDASTRMNGDLYRFDVASADSVGSRRAFRPSMTKVMWHWHKD